MTISISVLIGVSHLREQAKSSFSNSVSGIDLIIGGRSSNLNLLLYSVFRIGSPTNNISWQSYLSLTKNNSVRWAVPISLGDSHRGYRVLGTTTDYFDFYRYGKQQPITFNKGDKVTNIFDVVLGANVAKKLGYKLNDKITLSHGSGQTSFQNHDQMPFKIVGILNATGTPVDNTVHVTLLGIEAVHKPELLKGNKLSKLSALTRAEAKFLTPKSITAIMVGLHSKMQVFNYQRLINTNKNEPLTAILPGVALAELWRNMAIFDNAMQLITLLVFVSSLIGISTMLLASITERLNEISLLRMIGASPIVVFLLIELEAMVITLLSVLLALTLLSITLSITQTHILSEYGITLEPNIFTCRNLQSILWIFLFVSISATLPAFKAFTGAKNNHG